MDTPCAGSRKVCCRIATARRMESIGKGVWELKTADERTWYRVIYLTRIGDALYVLHAFEKSSRKTDRRDLEIAKSRIETGS